MNFIRKHKKVSIIILVILIIFLFLGVTFGRYILNIVNSYILETKAFYFNSSVLSINGKNYSINNWDGVNPYTLTVDLNNRKNDGRSTTADISYEVYVDCSDSVTCELSVSEGILYQDDHTASYQITVTPNKNFYEGDTVRVETRVISTSPYKKTLSATYNIGIEKSMFSYSIVDSVNSKYLTLNFTNSITYYEVQEAFGNYEVGNQISVEDYNSLSDEDKKKCFSAEVILSFDPNEFFLDMTNDLYLNRLNENYETTDIHGFSYVSKFSFKLNATSSSNIIFYKNDITRDYTYPIVNESSAINVSVNTAN